MGSSIFRNQPKQNSTGLNPAIIEQAMMQAEEPRRRK